MRLLVFEELLQGGAHAALHLLAVLLLHGLCERVDVAEDEVELGVAAALVRPEHDGVRRLAPTTPLIQNLLNQLNSI